MGISTKNARRSTLTICVVTLLLAALTFGATSQSEQLRHHAGRHQGLDQGRDRRSSTSARSRTSSTTTFGDTEADQQGVRRRHQQERRDRRPQDRARCTRSTRRSRAASPTRCRCAPRAPRTTRSSRCSACSSTSPARASCASRKEHHVIHIGHELDQPWIDEAPGGLLLTPDATKEGVAAALVNLLAETGKLKGKTVAVVGDKNNESRVNDVIVPALKKAKVKTGFDRHPQHHRHRHHRGPGAARQLHREVEDRGRRHGVPRRQPRVGEAVRRVDQGGAAQGAAGDRHRHHARPGPGRAGRRGRSPTRTRA